MTSELDAMFVSLQNNYVPDMWSRVGYLSIKRLNSWFDDLVIRVAFFRNWLRRGKTLFLYWISAFYFPQGFLTSILQRHSRVHCIPVDTLDFQFLPKKFSDCLDLDPEQLEQIVLDAKGFLIYGTFLDGAQWDFESDILEDQEPGLMTCVGPCIEFIPKHADDLIEDTTTSEFYQYNCPLYKTGIRAGTLSTTGLSTNFIITIFLAAHEKPQYWTLKGVALLSMTAD